MEYISEFLGMTGQLASEENDGTLRYEWQFKILEGKKIAAIQPFVCDVVDGKIVKNEMLARRPIGGPPRRPRRRSRRGDSPPRMWLDNRQPDGRAPSAPVCNT